MRRTRRNSEQLDCLLDRMQAGEQMEVVITRDHRPVAVLISHQTFLAMKAIVAVAQDRACR